MRFPALADLDREQRAVYAEAPTDGALLVVGPPGTGKTVMAFHRAQKASALGQSPRVVMFNSVLESYTSDREGVAENVPVSTLHGWVDTWWRKAFRKRAPRVPSDGFQEVDWGAVLARAMELRAEDPGRFGQLAWGHLLIDEGQDFPEAMYLSLGVLSRELGKSGQPANLTIFADDNQRLHVHTNSDTQAIRRNLFIDREPARNRALRTNFRNTREIAELAGYFRVGKADELTQPPTRRGEVPRVLFFGTDKQLADQIIRKAALSPGKQVGVVVCGSAQNVHRTYNQLEYRATGKPLRVQMYTNQNRNAHPADQLDFTSGGTITVLHQNSAKGLEFDIVYFVGLERMRLDDTGGLNERMALYVMCSRAREELYLAIADVDPAADPPHGLGLLPRPGLGLCHYDGYGEFDAAMTQRFISRIKWLNPDGSAAAA